MSAARDRWGSLPSITFWMARCGRLARASAARTDMPRARSAARIHVTSRCVMGEIMGDTYITIDVARGY